MAKHDRAKKEKAQRNLIYALMYRQYQCKFCKHRTCRPGTKGRCPSCGEPEAMKIRRR